MKLVDPAYEVLYSELKQRGLDAAFESDFSLDGRFVRVSAKGRSYWYFDTAKDGKKVRRYVGPVDDAEISSRVENFKNLKADYRARRKLVSTLVREAYLPAPPLKVGAVVQAMADAGFFRLRGVLVGTVAFQCYSAGLGVRLPGALLQTGDADFAQFHSISVAVGDSMPNILGVLQEVDATFGPVPRLNSSELPSKLASRDGYQVEFLTPNTGTDDYVGKATPMPALGNIAAEPLRFLDFLIYEPVRAVLLHGAGVPVLVPAPERYAIHKLIVATRRLNDDNGRDKRQKDMRQAETLMQAMIATRQIVPLADAFIEAWQRGQSWRSAITQSLGALTGAADLKTRLAEGVVVLGHKPEDFDL
jgi:hypothetical protein